MNTIKDRINFLIKGSSQRQIAKKLGISPSTLNQYVNGRTPPVEFCVLLCDHFQVSERWLLRGEGGMSAFEDTSPKLIDENEFVLVPLYDMKVSAGGGAEVLCETVKTQMAFRRFWITQVMGMHPSELALFLVVGDSMEPTICQGDIILINREKTNPSSDSIFLIRQDNNLLVKRLQPIPGNAVMVISDNRMYHQYQVVLTESADFQILGQVVWFGRKLIS